MFKKQREEQQEKIWMSWQAVKDRSGAEAFYGKLHDLLEKHQFGDRVRGLTEGCYKQTGTGRPGIVPEVYFRMLMVGFFEGLGSERGIAARCGDRLMIRTFLGNRLGEATPDHSSLSVIRYRLGKEVHQQVFVLMLEMLKAYGLLKGKNPGIDSSVIEANASLRELVNCNTEEAYWEYVKRLAAESGVDPQDSEAVRRFDAKREGRQTSNQEWVNPQIRMPTWPRPRMEPPICFISRKTWWTSIVGSWCKQRCERPIKAIRSSGERGYYRQP